ncbi:MAG: PEGA domain-containing protein, partial [Myxococcaceae bacterium]|nr:PEGA domain-containing protein [Myxococcaceae bacterium]
VIVQHHTQPPPPFRQLRPELEVPPEVEALVQKCLAKRPEHRFAHMDELLEKVRQVGGLSNSGTISGLRTNPGNLRLVSPDRSPSGAAERPSSITSASRARLPLTPGQSGPQSGAVTGVHRVVKPASNAGVYIALGAFGATVGAVGIALLLTREPAVATDEAAVADQVQVPAAAGGPTEEEETSASKKVVVVVNSVPSGATVTYRGKDVGVTPVHFSVPTNRKGVARAEVTLSLAGHVTVTETLVGEGPTLTLNRQLELRPEPPPPPPRPASNRTKPASGYKEDPY